MSPSLSADSRFSLDPTEPESPISLTSSASFVMRLNPTSRELCGVEEALAEFTSEAKRTPRYRSVSAVKSRSTPVAAHQTSTPWR